MISRHVLHSNSFLSLLADAFGRSSPSRFQGDIRAAGRGGKVLYVIGGAGKRKFDLVNRDKWRAISTARGGSRELTYQPGQFREFCMLRTGVTLFQTGTRVDEFVRVRGGPAPR
jgi:hypothetical protein